MEDVFDTALLVIRGLTWATIQMMCTFSEYQAFQDMTCIMYHVEVDLKPLRNSCQCQPEVPGNQAQMKTVEMVAEYLPRYTTKCSSNILPRMCYAKSHWSVHANDGSCESRMGGRGRQQLRMKGDTDWCRFY